MPDEQKPDFRYIAIEGPIGVGKSSLAQRLAQDYRARLILEQVDDNPFLELFYAGSKSVALPTQLHFLLSRLQQLKTLSQEDLFSSISVSDFVIEKDRLFASLTLDRQQFELYQMLYEALVGNYIKPDLIVYLQAPVEVLIKRILKRGRHFEKKIEENYLESLSAAYSDFFYHYDERPLLIINVGDIDFVESEVEYRNLKQVILSTDGGKRYYNPLKSGMSL